MKDILVPIDKAGRVVLPKPVREELAIYPGDMLRISIHGNEVTLCPNKDTSGFVRRGKALVFSSSAGEALKRETVDAILAESRDPQTIDIARATVSPKRKR